MTLTAIVLLTGWMFGSIGVATAPYKAPAWKLCGIVLVFLFFAGWGGFLYWHFRKSPGDGLAEGASVILTALGPMPLRDGSYNFPVKIDTQGEDSVLNYTYWFGQHISDHILTVQEENKQFDELAGSKFYPDIEKADKENISPDAIFNRLDHGQALQLMQPKIKLDSNQLNQINSEKLFVYDFLVFRYTDKSSLQKRNYYYAEFCGRYMVSSGGVIPCPYHNFTKRPGK
jgi:hypothetical protein